jgi:hypothetical protein
LNSAKPIPMSRPSRNPTRNERRTMARNGTRETAPRPPAPLDDARARRLNGRNVMNEPRLLATSLLLT